MKMVKSFQTLVFIPGGELKHCEQYSTENSLGPALKVSGPLESTNPQTGTFTLGLN